MPEYDEGKVQQYAEEFAKLRAGCYSRLSVEASEPTKATSLKYADERNLLRNEGWA